MQLGERALQLPDGLSPEQRRLLNTIRTRVEGEMARNLRHGKPADGDYDSHIMWLRGVSRPGQRPPWIDHAGLSPCELSILELMDRGEIQPRTLVHVDGGVSYFEWLAQDPQHLRLKHDYTEVQKAQLQPEWLQAAWRFTASVMAIIVRINQDETLSVLIEHRRNRWDRGRHALPGGIIEWTDEGLDPLKTLQKEVAEESGIPLPQHAFPEEEPYAIIPKWHLGLGSTTLCRMCVVGPRTEAHPDPGNEGRCAFVSLQSFLEAVLHGQVERLADEHRAQRSGDRPTIDTDDPPSLAADTIAAAKKMLFGKDGGLSPYAQRFLKQAEAWL